MHYAAESVHWNSGKHALDDRAVCTTLSVYTQDYISSYILWKYTLF